MLMLQADNTRSPRLGDLLKAEVPTDWPPSDYAEALPEIIRDLELRPEMEGWWVYYFVRKRAEAGERKLIGCGGFKGCPSEDGSVEMGYGLLPEFHRQGFASEAAFAMVAFAFGHPTVSRVFADTGVDNTPSRHLLEKLGFRPIGDGAEAGTIRYDLPRALFVARAKIY